MSIAIDYYLNKGAEKTQEVNRLLSEKWSESRVKSAVESFHSYRFQEGEQIEVDGTTYQIEERTPFWTALRKEETYKAKRFFEGPEGKLHPIYDTEKITGGQII